MNGKRRTLTERLFEIAEEEKNRIAGTLEIPAKLAGLAMGFPAPATNRLSISPSPSWKAGRRPSLTVG